MARSKLNASGEMNSDASKRSPSEREPEQDAAEADGKRKAKPVLLKSAAGCRRYAQQRLAECLPEVVPAFLDAARDGSNPHLKTLLQLCGLDRALPPTAERKRKEKGLEEILREQWQRDDEAEAARGAAAETSSSNVEEAT